VRHGRLEERTARASQLTPDPRPAADAETRLQGLVLLPVLDSCPDEHGNDKNEGQEDEDSEDNRRRDVHLKRSYPVNGSRVSLLWPFVSGAHVELEPGRYRAGFVLDQDAATYTRLARLLERVRHWRQTDVHEDDEPVSAFHAKDIRVSGCPISPESSRLWDRCR
jgi:hypothetical protein